MAIFYKRQIAKDIEEFKIRAHKLQAILNGGEPNPNLYEQYHGNPETYRQEFTEIDMKSLGYAIDDFKTSLSKLAKLEKEKAKQRPR